MPWSVHRAQVGLRLCKLELGFVSFEPLLVLAADTGCGHKPVVFNSKSFTFMITKTRACEALTAKNTTQELIRNWDARWAMLCSPVWHECMRLTRRWWEVGGEKPSYNFTTLATAADAALSLQQVSILKGGWRAGRECCSLQLAVQSQRYINVLIRCLCSSLYCYT